MFRYFSRSAVLLVDNKKLEEAVKGKTRDPLVQIRFKDLCKSAYAWRKMDLSLRYWAFSKTEGYSMSRMARSVRSSERGKG
ncbi:hypothetical protein EJB05_15141 [Eragrostis curvula]|uniref:Uncharacterized protein n=1 Tax=Eragrostis curvula TaxID=38414 RepID=A0A5J9VZJ2_9POAL|nr:hypothetical protein EJB05_15141 [Eragrostis curvula]